MADMVSSPWGMHSGDVAEFLSIALRREMQLMADCGVEPFFIKKGLMRLLEDGSGFPALQGDFTGRREDDEDGGLLSPAAAGSPLDPSPSDAGPGVLDTFLPLEAVVVPEAAEPVAGPEGGVARHEAVALRELVLARRDDLVDDVADPHLDLGH